MSILKTKDLLALAEAYLADAEQHLKKVQARQFVMEFNSKKQRSTSAIALVLADCADLALDRGDDAAAKAFFNMALSS